jgi:hypothetical protein
MLRCTRVLIWGLLGWVWAQLELSLAGIWKEYRYGVWGYEFFSGEALWGYEEGAGVVYRFWDAAAAETLWKGAFPIAQIAPSRAHPEEVLLFEQVERLYRRSARYRVYLLSGGKVTPIPGLYQEAELLPDGRVVLADSQNLYLWNRSSSELERLTSVRGAMQAGTTDWLYEEEFGFTKAFAASPSGAYLAYLHLDNTETPHLVAGL